MNSKITRIIGLLVAVGSSVPILIVGLFFDLAPFNHYKGVFWMCFIPMAMFYMDPNAKTKNLWNMLCSYVLGLGWGFLGVVITPALKMNGEFPFALVEYFVLVLAIIIVCKCLLYKTWFNCMPATFLAFALSIAASTTYWYSGNNDPVTFALLPITETWNQLDLLIIFIWGIVMTLLVNLLSNFLVGTYLKKKGMIPSPDSQK